MSKDHPQRPNISAFLFVAARLGVLIFILLLVAGGFIAYQMLETGNIEQAVAYGNLTAVRGFHLLEAPTPEALHYQLYLAACGHYIDVAEYLLEKGADPNQPPQEGYFGTNFPVLTEYLTHCWPGPEKDEMVELLLAHGAHYGLEHDVLLGNLTAVREGFAADPATVERRYGNAGYTLLHFAAAAGQYATVAYLLEAGLNPHQESELGRHKSSELASGNEHDEVYALLVEAENSAE